MTLVNLVPGLKRTSARGNEHNGPCPFCGGTDRFIVWVESDRFWCRQCNRKGDSIQLLRDLHGLTFQEALLQLGRDPTPLRGLHLVDPHKTALAAAKKAFSDWQDAKAQTFHAEHRQLIKQKEQSELLYRLAVRFSSLFTEHEQSRIIVNLARIYDRLTVLKYHIHLLVDNFEVFERLVWWDAEEVENE